MKLRLLLAAAAIPAVAVGAWWALRAPQPAENAAEQAIRADAAAGPAHGDAIVARRTGAAAARASAPQVPPEAPRLSLLGEFVHAKSYRALYERLRATPEGQTPEGEYVLYEILRKCATIPDRPYSWRQNNKPVEQRRQEFLATLPANDPQRDKRVAAFDAVAVNPCAGFEGISASQVEVSKLLADAAAGGDPKARAVAVEQEIWQSRRGGHWYSTSLSDEQIETLRQAAGTRDPEALLVAGRLLSNSWRDLTVQVGADGTPVEPRAFYNAWEMLACQYGYPCGDDNARLLTECAYHGHCEASTLPDYLSYYGSSPYEAQLMSRYQSVLRQALESGDWSQVTFARGSKPPNPASRFIFSPAPR